jgi:hypothetical protein
LIPPGDLVEVIARAVEAGVGRIFTATPCRVVVYDPATECADLAPCVRRPTPTEQGTIVHEPLPILPNVPIAFPRGGGVSITFDLSPGDFVIALAMTYSIGQWRTMGGVDADAGDVRTNHPAHCFGLPLMSASPANLLPALAPSLKLGAPDATEAAVLGNALHAWLTAITTTALAPAGGGAVTFTPPSDPLYASLDSILSLIVKVK